MMAMAGSVMPSREIAGTQRGRATTGRIAVLALVLIGAIAILALPGLDRAREQAAIDAAETRLAALAGARAEVLAASIAAQERAATRIVGSDLVRLLVGEWAVAAGDGLLREALREQLPYLQTVLDDFARAQALVGAGLVGSDGRWIAADGQIMIAAPRREEVAKAALGARATVLRVELEQPTRLIAALPVAPLDTGEGGEAAPIAALLLVSSLQEQLAGLLRRRPIDGAGEAVAVLAHDARGRPMMVQAGQGWQAAPEGWAMPGADGVLPGPSGRPVVLHRAGVAGTPFTVVQWIDLGTVLMPAQAAQRTTWSLAALGIGLLALASLALVRHLGAREQQALAEQYRDLAGRIEAQRSLLDSVTASVPEMIGLIEPSGCLRYANQPLALATGRGLDSVLGRPLGELLDRATASTIGRLVARAREAGLPTSATERLLIGGELRSIDLSARPFTAGESNGTVLLVARDVTELMEARERRERRVRQTVDAFARAVELADPWLLGHTRRLRETALAIATRQGLEPAEIALIELSASLSQVGKLFVPRELLTKTERHTPDETAQMRAHVGHALRVLGEVELDLPVAEAIAQMQERLDGTGYPAGLAGAAIRPAARVLAVADVFCARTSPRSYRDATAADLVLAVLRNHPERYDATAVAALAAELEQRPTDARS